MKNARLIRLTTATGSTCGETLRRDACVGRERTLGNVRGARRTCAHATIELGGLPDAAPCATGMKLAPFARSRSPAASARRFAAAMRDRPVSRVP
ncbi:hypothetical protein WT54_12520 [Burkholderia territorii]|nr:hypothetical protein WT54_12520 [Burkholderia territorii]